MRPKPLFQRLSATPDRWDSPHPINGLAQGYKINGATGESGFGAAPLTIAAATCRLHLPRGAGEGSVIIGISTKLAMKFIDESLMDGLSATAFQATKPYPWLNPKGFLQADAYRRLVDTLPPAEIFNQRFGEKRKYGQQSHDRLSLDYAPEVPLAPTWHDFVAELKSERYLEFVRRMFGRRAIRLLFHWHYTPNGCSVSPHCDAKRKLGSHIFYMNTDSEWQPDWGGETLILDDNGRFGAGSAPKFEDFDRAMPSTAVGNYSLLFQRRERSWHGVKEIKCPPDALRKVFIVVIEDWTLPARLMAKLKGGKRERY